jgi:hypothetical protein
MTTMAVTTMAAVSATEAHAPRDNSSNSIDRGTGVLSYVEQCRRTNFLDCLAAKTARFLAPYTQINLSAAQKTFHAKGLFAP